MKIFKVIASLGLIVVAIAATGLSATTCTVDPRAWWACVQVWRLNHGLVSINDFDWHLLKVGSGTYGEQALKDLNRRGATDDIRITAAYVLTRYVTPDSTCTDAPCGFETSMKGYKPVAAATTMKKDLRPGQVLPHDFVIETALSLPACTECVLRMQDFDGDGQDEVYVEGIRRSAVKGPEDEGRSITIYHKDPEGWAPYLTRVILYNFDARTYPQRPFTLEPDRMDRVRINGVNFRFVNYPDYRQQDFGSAKIVRAQAKDMQAFGPQLDAVTVVFPKGGHIPDGLARAMTAGRIGLAPNIANPLAPAKAFDYAVSATSDTALPILCYVAANCRAIVADLDHDGHAEVIVMRNGDPKNPIVPGDGTLLKTLDGKTWRIEANVELCQEIVPDITKAKIEIVPPSKWRLVRLGQDLYPIIPNPYCDKGAMIL